MVEKSVGFLFNSKGYSIVDSEKRGPGVSLGPERGTAHTAVKAPKYQLSAKGVKVFIFRDSEEVGSEAATL